MTVNEIFSKFIDMKYYVDAIKELLNMPQSEREKLTLWDIQREDIIAAAQQVNEIMQKYGKFVATKEDTEIFIKPGYKFLAIDALITNFHLPKSTLIMLVSAFMGREFTFEVYQHAIEKKYRFFSFGDSMFIHG